MQTITPCPYCGKPNKHHEHVDFPHYRPVDGDISMCIGCGGWGIFTDLAQKIRVPTEAEMRGILADPKCQKHMRAWAAMKRTTARALH